MFDMENSVKNVAPQVVHSQENRDIIGHEKLPQDVTRIFVNDSVAPIVDEIDSL